MAHAPRQQLESLCLNGCGKPRSGASAYCSHECRKKLWKWIDDQIQLDDGTVHQHLERKCKRFKDALRRAKRTTASL